MNVALVRWENVCKMIYILLIVVCSCITRSKLFIYSICMRGLSSWWICYALVYVVKRWVVNVCCCTDVILLLL